MLKFLHSFISEHTSETNVAFLTGGYVALLSALRSAAPLFMSCLCGQWEIL